MRLNTVLHRFNGLFSVVGLEMVRKERLSRPRLGGALVHVRGCGIAPKTIIDVGAAYGDWTATCHRVFPAPRYLLVEPLQEFADLLNARVQELGNAVYVPAAAAKASGVQRIHVHPDLVGSSLLLETEGHGVDGFEREIPATTVDEVVRSHEAPGPYLLKVDVQGAELDVLGGAAETLRSTDLIILEVSFFRFFMGGPQFYDVVAYMRETGFVVYDIFNLLYRPLDGALAQADVMFVPNGSPLRSQHIYAGPDQRRAQNQSSQRGYSRRRLRVLPKSLWKVLLKYALSKTD
jgi:FkbM family methyltransferase